jgi:putative inorganic carbon (HCO3(-)) transporter
MGTTLLFTQSRGGLIGLTISILFVVTFTLRGRWRWLFGGGIFLIVIFLAGNWALSSDIFLREEQNFPENANVSLLQNSDLNNLNTRLEIWSRAIYGIRDFPFTGMGVDMFRRIVPILYPLFIVRADVDIDHAHNQFLQAALDIGIPGLIAYVGVWLGSVYMLWTIWGKTSSIWLRSLTIGFGATLIGYFVFSLTDTIALGGRPGFIFWLLLGLIAGMHNLVRSPNNI